MERKVQQLTKVIYHLNSKAEEPGELGEQAASYENEIEGILRDAGERVKRFQAACSHAQDMKLIESKVHDVEVKYEMQKQRALKEMEEFKRRAKDAQVRNTGEKRVQQCAPAACMHAYACSAAHEPVSSFRLDAGRASPCRHVAMSPCALLACARAKR